MSTKAGSQERQIDVNNGGQQEQKKRKLVGRESTEEEAEERRWNLDEEEQERHESDLLKAGIAYLEQRVSISFYFIFDNDTRYRCVVIIHHHGYTYVVIVISIHHQTTVISSLTNVVVHENPFRYQYRSVGTRALYETSINRSLTYMIV